MHIRLVALAAVLAAVSPSIANADPVTYTLNGTFTGSLGAQSFTSVAGTLTFRGDDSNTASLGAGFYTNNKGVSTIMLAGLGTATFLSLDFGVESQFDGAGFFDTASGFGVDIYDPALGPYALTAPFSDTALLERSLAASFGVTELTDLGDLSLDGDDATSATFTASKATQLAATPEPGSLALLSTGVLCIGGALRRRTA